MSCDDDCDAGPLEIPQGKNWSEIFQWLSDTPTYKPIAAATLAAPSVLQVTGHGLQTGWLFTIEGDGAGAWGNATPIVATVVDADHLQLDEVNALGFAAYVGGGVIKYYAPLPLAGLTPRMQIREKLTSVDPVITFAGGNLIVDLTKRWVTAQLFPADTAGKDFDAGVFDLEMVDGGGLVPLFDNGTVVFIREVTK